MGVRRRDVDIRWFASLSLIVLGSVIYRFKTLRDRSLSLSLEEFARRYWYVPSWMSTISRSSSERLAQQSFRKSVTPNSTDEARKFVLQRQYKRMKWFADKVLFR